MKELRTQCRTICAAAATGGSASSYCAQVVILEAGCCQADYSIDCVLTATTNRSEASLECG